MRTTKKTTILGAGLAGLALLAGAMPAGAVDTTVTFTLPAGGVAVSSASATATLSTVSQAAGALTTISGTLPELTVTDTRNQLLASWTVTASMASDFSNGASGTIAKANATVNSPTVGTLTQGAGGGGVVTPASASMAGSGGAIATAASVVGNSTATLTPSMTVTVPRGTTAATYTGVVTITVS